MRVVCLDWAGKDGLSSIADQTLGADMAVTRDLAQFTLDLEYDRIPSEVRHEAMRLIVDSLACAIGGFSSEPGTICRDLARELGGPPEATIFGEKTRVSCFPAIVANETMIRYLDYNDSLDLVKGPGNIAAVHPSDALPAAIAVGERVGVSGKKLVEATVAGYEVMGQMLDAFTTGLEPRGFLHGSVIAYGAAAIAGKLLGLTADQLAHAMGIAGSVSIGLGILDAEGEQYTMTKNIADGFLSERGVVAAFLARKGFTGPDRIIEGNKGFAQTVLGGQDRYRPRPDPDRFWLLETTMKYFCAEATTAGHLSATTDIVREHKLAPTEIEAIRIRASQRTVFHTGDPAKKFPTNKETADHSSYFLTAVALLAGRVGPAAYTPRLYSDPRVHRLIDKVQLVHGPEFDSSVQAAAVEIVTRNGARYRKRVDCPKGHPENRMTDYEIREKFLDCAASVMSTEQVDRVIETFSAVDRVDDIRTVMPLLAVS